MNEEHLNLSSFNLDSLDLPLGVLDSTHLKVTIPGFWHFSIFCGESQTKKTSILGQVFNWKGLLSFFSMMKVYLQKGFKLKCQWQTIEIFSHMIFFFWVGDRFLHYNIYIYIQAFTGYEIISNFTPPTQGEDNKEEKASSSRSTGSCQTQEGGQDDPTLPAGLQRWLQVLQLPVLPADLQEKDYLCLSLTWRRSPNSCSNPSRRWKKNLRTWR